MPSKVMRGFLALAVAFSLPVGATPIAGAAPVSTVSDSAENGIDEAGLARYFKELDDAQNDEEARAALTGLLGAEAVARAFRENSTVGAPAIPRGAGTFLTCVKGKASDDIKSVFDVNVVAAAIGQKDYVKAAKEAVKHLAKNGVKRNAAVLAGMFAYWGWQCRSSW